MDIQYNESFCVFYYSFLVLVLNMKYEITKQDPKGT